MPPKNIFALPAGYTEGPLLWWSAPSYDRSPIHDVEPVPSTEREPYSFLLRCNEVDDGIWIFLRGLRGLTLFHPGLLGSLSRGFGMFTLAYD